MPLFYPGWIMRLYVDDKSITPDLCELACRHDYLDLCHAGQLPGTPMVDARLLFPMNWRFYGTLDPQAGHPI